MLKITLLGSPSFNLNNQLQDDLFVTSKAKALLVYLVMHNGPCSREMLASLLWGSSKQNNARSSLRQVLSHLQKQFKGYLDISRNTVCFDRSRPYHLDVEVWEQAVLEEAPLERQEVILGLYRGEFLAGFYVRNAQEFEGWALLERERLRLINIDRLQYIVEQSLSHQEYQVGLTHVEKLLTQDPWFEAGHGYMMTLLAYSGMRNAALKHYDQYRQASISEFTSEPGEPLKQLCEQIKAGLLYEQVSTETLVIYPEVDEYSPLDSQLADHDKHFLHRMPRLEGFYGRVSELGQLKTWLVTEQSCVVAIVGIGGQGKTALAARICQTPEVVDYFDRIIWQSLISAPPLEMIIEELAQFFYTHRQNEIVTDFTKQLDLVLQQLYQQRCLLVWDNVESVMDLGKSGYQVGYENFGQFIQRMGQTEHRSCLLLTSRESPVEVNQLLRDTLRVNRLSLQGIDLAVGQQILQAQEIVASNEQTQTLLERYSGNPLALKLTSDTIQTLFLGDVEAYLDEEVTVFGEIRDVLDQQLARLSSVEEQILIWLAIEREAVDMKLLWANLYDLHTRRALLEALSNLKNRSLLQTSARGFSLQNVVMEYLSDRLINQIYDEIVNMSLTGLQQYSLAKAQSKEYIRQMQGRIFLRPLSERLILQMGRSNLERQLKNLLTILQSKEESAIGYAAGNILNLLIYLGVDLRGYSFANLTVWQAYLQDVALPDVDFSNADLTGSVFLSASYRTRHISFSSNGNYLATAHFHDEVRVWNTEDLTPVRSFVRGDVWVGSAIFSPDGRWLAANGQDHTIYIWDYQTSTTTYTLTGHTNEISYLAFMSDSQVLVSASFDKTIRLWDVTNRQQVAVLEGHTGWINSIAISPDNTRLFSGSVDGELRLWSIEQKACEQVLLATDEDIMTVAISPDGKYLASSGGDKAICIWNLQTLTIEQKMEGHEYRVLYVTFSPDSKWLASIGEDSTIRLWHVEEGRLLRTMLTHVKLGYALDFHPDGSLLASCDEHYPIRLWDVDSGQPVYARRSPRQNEPCQLLFSQDGRFLISAHLCADIRLWTVQDTYHQVHIQQAEPTQDKRYLALSPNGSSLFCCGGDNIQVWEIPRMTLIKNLPSPSNRLTFIALGNKNELMAVTGIEYKIWIGNSQTGQFDQPLVGHSSGIHGLAFSPDDSILASSGYDHELRLWDTKSGDCLYILHTKSNAVYEVFFSPDGCDLISGDGNNISIWDVESGELTRRFEPFDRQDAACPLTINSQGSAVASATYQYGVVLWDYQTGKVIRQFEGHGSRISALQFSPDGQILATGSLDETMRLWDVDTGVCLAVLKPEEPYEGMNITNTIGLTASTRQALRQLGAIG